VRVSEPTAREPAGILIEAIPLVNGTAPEVNPPVVSVTAPVGTIVLFPPVTVIATTNAWDVVMLEDDRLT
jgi:hypothetical protein